jgi:hypothetical protein
MIVCVSSSGLQRQAYTPLVWVHVMEIGCHEPFGINETVVATLAIHTLTP